MGARGWCWCSWGNHINLGNWSPSHQSSSAAAGLPPPPVSALDSRGGCGGSESQDMHKQCTLPAARWGHKEKVKWRVLSLQISKSHESERSCTILDLGGQGRHKHEDPAQLHNIFIQGCWNTLGMYCISSCGNMRFMQIMCIFANMRMRLKISSTLTTYYLPK